MDTLDREIMTALLLPQKSMYELAMFIEQSKYLKKYPRIRRHVKNLAKDGLIEVEEGTRKDKKLDNRKTQKLKLTDRGLATLILEGNLNDKEFRLASQRIFLRMSSKLQKAMNSSGISGESILRNVFDRMKPKINLDCFDREYFENTFLMSMAEYLHETYKKASVDRIQKIRKQSIPKAGKEAISLMNEILETLEKEQRKFTRLASDLRRAVGYFEKIR